MTSAMATMSAMTAAPAVIATIFSPLHATLVTATIFSTLGAILVIVPALSVAPIIVLTQSQAAQTEDHQQASRKQCF